MYHWVSVLDRFDSLLERACSTTEGAKWQYLVDYSPELKELVLGILNFTALLIEYSCSRHIYGSIDHIITLLCVADLDVTLSVLNLLYVFSKRSTFLTRLNSEKRQTLHQRLEGLAESWGGKDNGFGLAECCDAHFAIAQRSATTLHFEFRVEDRADQSNRIESIYVDNISKFDEPVGKSWSPSWRCTQNCPTTSTWPCTLDSGWRTLSAVPKTDLNAFKSDSTQSPS